MPVRSSGSIIREARLRAGLSQVELSARSGKDRAQIARWERDVVMPGYWRKGFFCKSCCKQGSLGLATRSNLFLFKDRMIQLNLGKTIGICKYY